MTVMTLVEINEIVFATSDAIARVAPNIPFAITKRDGSATTVYDAAGNVVAGGTLQADAHGRIVGFWVKEGRYTITFPGSPTTPPLHIEAWAGTMDALAAVPDALIAGVIARDANGAATSAPVAWPDGTPGIYTATSVSAAFPGAVDAYTITYGAPVQKTYTQPAVTRDPTTGAVTNRPAITVS
jgi:hypothetical protein